MKIELNGNDLIKIISEKFKVDIKNLVLSPEIKSDSIIIINTDYLNLEFKNNQNIRSHGSL